LPLMLAENMIGRNPNFPISIDDTSIAQHHATIKIESGQAFLL
jgi:pSer/pThr/pTyr-binding forkhead associated (FHA) protein